VRLVDGEQGEGEAREPLQHRRLHQAFGREVEQVELAGVDLAPDAHLFIGIDVGVEPRRRHARLPERRHLVGHQGDQGGDDEAEPRPQHRRNLVAQALAAAGRQHRHRAAPGHHLADHRRLQAAEILMPEGAPQHLARSVERRRFRARLGFRD
jgi:hypothetical protein